MLNQTNQQPLFDMYDPDGNWFADESMYTASSFKGTKLFSYRQGTGTNDVELGFPISYRAIENVGDIEFDFNPTSDTFTYPSSYRSKQCRDKDRIFKKV